MSRDIKTPGPSHPITLTSSELEDHVPFYPDRPQLSVEAADGAED